jgi:hypothetical protein
MSGRRSAPFNVIGLAASAYYLWKLFGPAVARAAAE